MDKNKVTIIDLTRASADKIVLGAGVIQQELGFIQPEKESLELLGGMFDETHPSGVKSDPLLPEGRDAQTLAEFMKANNLDSSYQNRKELALYIGVDHYRGTVSQNYEMREKLKSFTR